MENNQDIPLRNFTIYLIKEELTEIEEIVNEKKVEDQEEIKGIGTFYLRKPKYNLPRWAKVFDGYLDDLNRIGHVGSSSGLLLIQEKERYFAITFGQGRYLLIPDCWEERFGLKVALNTIDENSIKSLDKKTFDDISMTTREQANKEVGARDFGLDIEKDLLRAVVGY